MTDIRYIENLQPLGKGHYGVVWHAELIDGYGTRTVVAMKMINKLPTTFSDQHFLIEINAIRAEIDNLAYLGEHENILKLIGAITNNIRQFCIVTEYCELGSLDKYLNEKKRTNRFMNEIVSTQYANDLSSTAPKPTTYKVLSAVICLD